MNCLINEWSKGLLDKLKLKQKFLKVDPSLWPEHTEHEEN